MPCRCPACLQCPHVCPGVAQDRHARKIRRQHRGGCASKLQATTTSNSGSQVALMKPWQLASNAVLMLYPSSLPYCGIHPSNACMCMVKSSRRCHVIPLSLHHPVLGFPSSVPSIELTLFPQYLHCVLSCIVPCTTLCPARHRVLHALCAVLHRVLYCVALHYTFTGDGSAPGQGAGRHLCGH